MGDIEYQDESGNNVQEFFTFDPVREEQNKINARHAELIFNIKFIQFDPDMIKQGFSFNAILLFGWIDFFTGRGRGFYITDQQIADMFGYSVATAERAVKELKDRGLVDCSYKITIGKGRLRKIQSKMMSQAPSPMRRLKPLTHEGATIVYKNKDRDKQALPLKTEKPNMPDKQLWLDFVWISCAEYQKLKDELGQVVLDQYIQRLNGYIGQIGEKVANKKYVSHYHVIANWVRKDKASGGFLTEKEFLTKELAKLGNSKFVSKYGKEAWQSTPSSN